MSEASPADLKRTMEESRGRGDITSYFEAEVELEKRYLEQGFACFSSAQFDDASSSFETVATLNSDLMDALDQALEVAKGESVPSTAELRDWRQQAQEVMLMARGYAAFADGNSEQTHRNPGAAAERFETAERAFRDASTAEQGEGQFMANYAAALRENASALEEVFRADYQGASTSFMQVKVKFNRLLKEAAAAMTSPKDEASASDPLASLIPLLELEASTIEAQFEKASYMAQFAQGNYQAASDHAKNLCTILQATVDVIPDELPDWQANSIRTNLASAQADQERATAFVLREREEWEEAQAAYQRARDKLQEAATFMLSTGLPDAAAVQEVLMAQASVMIPTEVRQLETERQLKEELKSLRAEWHALIAKLGTGGMTVNTIAQASAAAQQNTQIVMRIEQSVRDNLGKLQSAIDQADLGEEGQKLHAEAGELIASDEHGDTFLERARQFTGRVAEIVKNVADAAGPIVPVLRVLAPLVGLPIPF